MSSSAISLPAGANLVINQIEPEVRKNGAGQGMVEEVDDKKGNHDLAADLKAALKDLLQHYGTKVDKLARRYEVVDARRQRFYDRGYQYIYFNWGSYIFLPITAGMVMNVGADSVQMPRYCNVYNIYKPYRRNYGATLSQNPPTIHFEPKKPSNSLDIKTAECAEQYAEHYDQINDPKKLQTKMARLFYTDGRVVGWTRHEKNAEKWGTYQDREDEQIEQEDKQPDADAAAMGIQTDANLNEANEEDADEADEQKERDKAIGEEITTLHGVLESKCFPITAEDQDGLTGVILSDDPDINAAKEKYFWIAEEIKAGETGTGESAFERNARLGVLQGMRVWAQSNDAYNHLTERQVMFVRKAAFNHCSVETKARLKKMFPKGVRVTFISGEYAESCNTSLDDELKVEHPLDGDGMNRPSWGRDHMPVQDAFNNYRNMRQEYHDYGIPATYFDTQLMDAQAQRERVSQPGEFIPCANPSPGTQLEYYFYTPTAIAPPADLIQAEQDLRDALSQLVTGVQPALFGGNLAAGKDADRVGVYQMAREQAMGVMGLPWSAMQSMFAGFKGQAPLAAARNRRDEDKLEIMPRKKGRRSQKPISLTIADLKKGNFRAVPDPDSSFPASRAMKQQSYEKFLAAAENNPLLAEAAQQPDNMEIGAQLEGLPEIDIPAARAWRRQIDEIDQLLATGPVPPSQQQVQAAELKAGLVVAAQSSQAGHKAPPLPPEQQGPTPEQWADPQFIPSGAWLDNALMMSLAKSSVPAKKRDFHQYHIASIKDWMNSEEWDKAVDAGNIKGLANLELHCQDHEKFVEQEAAKAAGGAGQNKPPSQSMNFKDMPPEGKIQMAAEAGIKLSPQGVMPPPQAAGPAGAPPPQGAVA